MASLQCPKPAANPGHNTYWPFGHHAQQNQAQCYESETKYSEYNGVEKTQVQHYTESSTVVLSKGRAEHRRRKPGLLQKIKDGLSGHSDSDSCSSSDSENNDEKKSVKGKN